MRREVLLLGILMFVFLAINVVFASRSPVAWQDEVQLVDPAASYLTGRGFTSSAWIFQHKEETFAGNSPLYSGLLVGWMSVFGLGITSARSLNYVLAALAVVTIWGACRRSGLVRTPVWRLWLAGALLTGHTVTFSYRSGRFDTTMMLLAALAMLAGTLNHTPRRLLALATVASTFAWAGLHLLPYSAVLMGCMVLASRGRWIKETVAVGAGSAAGLGSMYWIYTSAGLWDAIGRNLAMQSAASEKGLVASLLARVAPTMSDIPGLLSTDLGILPVLALLAALAIRDLLRRRPLQGATVFAFLCWVGIPIFLRLVAKFPVYMGWMVCLPVVIAAASVFEQAWTASSERGARDWLSGRRVAILGYAAAIGASFTGLTGRVVKTAIEWNGRDYAPVERFVREQVSPGEHVFAWWSAFYALRPLPITSYYPPYLGESRSEYTYVGPMRDDEKALVTKMLIPPEEFEYSAALLGGRWIDTGQEFRAGSSADNPLYHLRVYVRERPASAD